MAGIMNVAQRTKFAETGNCFEGRADRIIDKALHLDLGAQGLSYFVGLGKFDLK